MRMLQSIVVVYLLLIVAVALFQRRLIYFPTRVASDVAGRAAAATGFMAWRSATGEVLGWRLPASGVRRSNVLIVHGNAGSAIDRDYFARPIHQAVAADVYILEYPGYGTRAGSPSMTSLLAAADEAFDFLPVNEPVYVVGESLGAGVAAHLAKTRGDRVSGLMLFMPYDNLVSVAQSKIPIVPVRLLLRDQFAPAVWLEKFRGPVKILLAGNDEIIPTRFGRRLYDGLSGPKELEVVPGARHNDVAAQTPAWWKGVFAFWEQSKQART
jgi:pimeloyl-ACP methyl ester carboxylesterase